MLTPIQVDPASARAAEPANRSEAASLELLTQIDSLLVSACGVGSSSSSADSAALIQNMASSLVALREVLQQRDRELESLIKKSDFMARAQADAIVFSAEIIDELEHTKESLGRARSAAEDAAQDTQRLADTIFEQTSDAVLVFNGETCIACNDNTVKLFGSARDAILTEWPNTFRQAKLENGESADSVLKGIFGSIDESGPIQMEMQLFSSEGTPFWSELMLSSFSMKGGCHVLVVIRDITSRKTFEAELRRHRDFLNNIISAVPDQLSVRSADQRVVLANRAFCRAHHVSLNDILGRRMDDLGLGDETRSMDEIELRLQNAAAHDAVEVISVAADGHSRVSSIKHSIFADVSSGERYVIATSRDITSDRMREERLKLLASVFEGATEGVAILNEFGQIREANPAFLAMTGRSSCEDLVGISFTVVLPRNIENFDAILVAAGNGHRWSGKITVNAGDVSARSLWVSLSPTTSAGRASHQIIALVSDITELENSQLELRHRAMHDGLTGLPNRVYFREILTKLAEEHADSATVLRPGFSVCFLDLDDFKHANDSLGHACGDQLLRQVAHRIVEVMGPDTFLARFGGDEFALILNDSKCLLGEQQQRLQQLLASFRDPFALGENEARVGLSIGVTRCPEDSSDVGTLMRNADLAMYAAKTSGKNAVRMFTPEMQDGVNLRHRVQTKLRDALNGGEIELHYQPKILAQSGRACGCEALVRWRSTDGKYIPPSEFVPIAEQTGLINAIGDVVFESATAQACRWFEAGGTPNIAVNVSPHQLKSPRFVENLIATMRRSGARPEWFELEITENAVMDDLELATSTINQVVDLGFRVAIDDFGTGHSSLSYLKTFNIHTLKIDISFVRDVTTDRHSEAIVRSIVSLGTGLGLNVVAEGVETAEQALLLREIGCNVLQGYYFGRPMPLDQYEQWARTWTGNS